jgi:hypothetical protein
VIRATCGRKTVQMNQSFLFNQIRKYNKAQRQSLKNKALVAIGIHSELLSKEVATRDLTADECSRVVYFMRQFCESQGVSVTIK